MPKIGVIYVLNNTSAAGTVEAGSEELAANGMHGDDMEALEAAAAPAPSRLPGFVSAGIVQPDRSAGQDAEAAEGTLAGQQCLVRDEQ